MLEFMAATIILVTACIITCAFFHRRIDRAEQRIDTLISIVNQSNANKH